MIWSVLDLIAHRQRSRTKACRMKNAMKLGICSCKGSKASGEKWRENYRENFQALAGFVSRGKREQRNFTRAFSMATSTHGFRTKFHGSTSASLAEMTKSWCSGRGWGQQLFSFQSPAVHWIARTSSLNCLSCRDPYQTPHSLNCLPPFSLKCPFFHTSSHPLPKNPLKWQRERECTGRRAKPGRFVGSLAFAMKNRHFGGECSWIPAGKARKCGRFGVFARLPNPGKQSIWRQCPPSARKHSTKKLPNRPGFTHVQRDPSLGPRFHHTKKKIATLAGVEKLTRSSLKGVYYWGQNDYMLKKLFWAINYWITSHYRTSVFVCPD